MTPKSLAAALSARQYPYDIPFDAGFDDTMNPENLAARRDVEALMLLSGPPSEAAVANMAGDADLAVFAAAATEDPVTVGVADALQGAVDGSPHASSTAKIYPGPEHGLPMFEKNADLEPALLAWLKGELVGN